MRKLRPEALGGAVTFVCHSNEFELGASANSCQQCSAWHCFTGVPCIPCSCLSPYICVGDHCCAPSLLLAGWLASHSWYSPPPPASRDQLLVLAATLIELSSIITHHLMHTALYCRTILVRFLLTQAGPGKCKQTRRLRWLQHVAPPRLLCALHPDGDGLVAGAFTAVTALPPLPPFSPPPPRPRHAPPPPLLQRAHIPTQVMLGSHASLSFRG